MIQDNLLSGIIPIELSSLNLTTLFLLGSNNFYPLTDFSSWANLTDFSFSKMILDPNDQSALVDFYNELTSKGSLNWNTSITLCGQFGVKCFENRATHLYNLFISLILKE